MNLKRFTARTSREALALVKAAFGDDAVVMSTRPCEDGVEVLAMAPESVEQLERVGMTAEPAGTRMALRTSTSTSTGSASVREKAPPPKARAAARAPLRNGERTEPTMDPAVEDDVEQLQMSTLSFQDYVRDRMLKRRSAERESAAIAEAPPAPLPPVVAPIEAARARHAARREVPVLRDEVSLPAAPRSAAPVALRDGGEQIEVMTELRSMRGLIEQRFGALAFMEKLQRHPRQASLARRLLDAGFSPMLIRKLVESLPESGDEAVWASGVLERNVDR